MSEEIMMREYEEELEEQQGFRVTDDAGAKWCVEKIHEADREYEEMYEWYMGQIKKAMAKRDATVDRMKSYLQDYAEQVPMKETKTQRSYAIPGGKLIWKKEHTEYKHDDAVVLEALKAQGRTEFVKTVEKLDWAGLKKEITQTGECIDGVTVETVPEEFKVQLEQE